MKQTEEENELDKNIEIMDKTKRGSGPKHATCGRQHMKKIHVRGHEEENLERLRRIMIENES